MHYQFTGSQESILQLDLDVEDNADTRESNDGNNANNSACPSFVIQFNQDVSILHTEFISKRKIINNKCAISCATQIRRHSTDSIALARYQHLQNQRQLNGISIDIETKCTGCMNAGKLIHSAIACEDTSRDGAFDKKVIYNKNANKNRNNCKSLFAIVGRSRHLLVCHAL